MIFLSLRNLYLGEKRETPAALEVRYYFFGFNVFLMTGAPPNLK